MEKRPEETAKNETTRSVEFMRSDCNISVNPIEPEGRRLVAPSDLHVSACSDWPGISVHTNLDTVKDHNFNRGEMSSAHSTPTLTSPYSITDVGLTFGEVIAKDYRFLSPSVAGCSSAKEGDNDLRKWLHQLESNELKGRIANEELMSKGKELLDASSKEDFGEVLSIFKDEKNLSSSKSMVDSCGISTVLDDPTSIVFSSSTKSTPVVEGSNNIIASDTPVGGSFSSSSSNIFLRQSLKMKGVQNKNPGESGESQCRVHHKSQNMIMVQNENMPSYSSGEGSSDLINRNSVNRLHLHNIVGEGSELPHGGINLREWLKSKDSNTSKNVNLRIFKKIVEKVDVAHSQGIALMELQPSSFIIFETEDVEYIGSVIETELWNMNQGNTKKRGLKPEHSGHYNFREKMQKVGDDNFVMPETRFVSRFIKDKSTNMSSHDNIDTKNSMQSTWNAQPFSIYEGRSNGNSWLTSDNAQLEKKWYAFPEGFKIRDLLPLNIYSLGIMLFEFLCHFESVEAQSAAMLDLQHRILPSRFLSGSPKEAGFCFWLLHPEPSSRPTTREILQSELIYGSDSMNLSEDEASCVEMVDDAESDLLLHFLVTLKQNMHDRASSLLGSMEFLDEDIKVVERQACGISLDVRCVGTGFNLKGHRCVGSPCSTSSMNVLREKLFGNINELENVYFSVRSNTELAKTPDVDRSDMDVLRNRERLSWVQPLHKSPTTEEKSVDRLGILFDGICKFARYKFEVCGTLRNGDILSSNNMICSLSLDRGEEYIAAAGVSKKIKIFELASLLDDYVDVQYPVLEMSSKAKFSCICWNNYIKNYLASTDYDGTVQLWDVNTGNELAQYNDHQKRAWSVDFSRVDPARFASGGDDCSLRIWSINEGNSICTIWNPANVCCVQFSSYSSHLLAFGSADYRIYCYDLRHTRIPWCTLAGHSNTVSYVRFLDPETLVSASTDSTLKLWDLKKTSLDGLSPNACNLTFSGHTNERSFVGMAALDGYIACGSETNEVYAYHRSLPMPITCHEFGCISGDEFIDGNGHFVSSVCWRGKSQMLAVANSSGSLKILRMA